jgi:hypothetical protein
MLKVVATLYLFGLWLWCALAIRFSGFGGETIALAASVIYCAGVPLAVIFLPNRRRTAYGILVLGVGVFLGWTQIKPSHHRDWVPSVSKLPYAEILENQAVVHNIRNFDYRTEKDFTAHYYDKTFDLDQLESVDYVLSHWDGLEAVAHSIFSFGFESGEHLAVSVETRLEKGEPQSALRGLFKQYELIYVLADEKDLIRLRTNFRKEDVYLYPTTVNKEKVRKLFLVILNRVNDIAENPQFYNTLSQNCLTSLASDFKKVITPKSFFDFRRIANGYSDEMLYENGWIDYKGEGFEETKKLRYINQYVEGNSNVDDFSKQIRPYVN